MNDKLTLTELQLLIRDALYLSLPQMFWVTAEISELTVNASGHCYLELIEKQQDDKNIRSRIRAIIWNSRFGIVRSFFENITGENLRPGLKILVKARVEYHEIYGLSIVINDIDPAFTLGEMALKRQQIIKRLEDEGVLSMNRELDFPFLPQRIAVISSKNAAGYTDFINHLKSNSYGYIFYTALIETPMQGTETEAGVVSSLDRIAEKADMFDLVVIIRGGGSQTDLSWFDSYAIAYHITQFPLPVIAGIGHEKNMSVTDLVANKSLKTPTAVADFLIESMAAAEVRLNELCSEMRDATLKIIENNRSMVEAYGTKLLPLAKIMIAENREKLSGKIYELSSGWRNAAFRYNLEISGLSVKMRAASGKFTADWIKSLLLTRKNLQNNVRNNLTINGSKILNMEANLKILNPENILRRGFTITSLNGKILRSWKQASTGDKIGTLFSDGKVTSSVTDSEETKSRMN